MEAEAPFLNQIGYGGNSIRVWEWNDRLRRHRSGVLANDNICSTLTGSWQKETAHQRGSCLTDLNYYFRELSYDDALPKSISTKTES